MLSPLTAIVPSASAGPTGIVATTLLVVISTRDRVLSSQFGTHKAPNPTASPAHGFLPTSTTAETLFVLGSIRDTLFFDTFEIHTESGATAIQSGVPSIAIADSGRRLAIGR